VPLEAVMSNAQWELVYARIAELVEQHSTTLVFVNTRRMAERAARHLGELLGKQHVAAHHGSLSKELRLDAEQRLKAGALKVLVATASLELGIDIGDVDLVCQIGSGVPKGRLLPTTRDELLECAALLDSVRRGELDALIMPPAPLDVLAQQIVAEVAACEWDEDALFALVRRAQPYASLTRKDFDEVVRMLADGFSTRFGQRAAYLHRDAVHRKLRGRKGARLIATQSGGTIPDVGDYSVLLEPQAIVIGSVNEDFAIESMAGDVFQLGNASYRILRVEAGKVRVEDAQGLPPSIPFWLGEAPGRSIELSQSVSRLRAELQARLEAEGSDAALRWLRDGLALGASAAAQIVEYAAAQLAGFGMLPTQQHIALERFFDESGGTQLVIHSPYGSRINKAWGLALRKRFCRKFNFELQAAATEDAIVLSLSTSHSFPLIEVMSYLHSSSAEQVLVQALLDAPLFPARFRWNATTALALPRFVGGRKVAPQLQRMKSEDLMATVFPDQVACLENIVGEREVPDHPLVAQTLHDCLREAMDVGGWLALLRAARPDRAVAVHSGSAQCAAVCLPRRCAAGGTSHPCGAVARLRRCGAGGRPRAPGPRCDRGRARRRLAAAARCRRDARSADAVRHRHRRRGGSLGLARIAGESSLDAARDPAANRQCRVVGHRRTPAATVGAASAGRAAARHRSADRLRGRMDARGCPARAGARSAFGHGGDHRDGHRDCAGRGSQRGRARVAGTGTGRLRDARSLHRGRTR